MTSSPEKISPPRCQAEGCPERQGVMRIKVELVPGLKADVALCARHRKEWFEQRQKMPRN